MPADEMPMRGGSVVDNSIEFGQMAPYAEDFSILRPANVADVGLPPGQRFKGDCRSLLRHVLKTTRIKSSGNET